MKPLPKAFQGLDWKGWKLVEEPNKVLLMRRLFLDADDCLHVITIGQSGWFEIDNVDGEIDWGGMFPSVERAHRAAMTIIEGMAR